MKSTPLIKQLQEDGMGAGDVAGAATPLFASMVRRSKRPKLTTIKSYMDKPVVAPRKLGIKESFARDIAVHESIVDTTSAISKLKGLEKREQANNQPMATFGLDDENGVTVRVSVPADQGADFEKSLQSALTMDEDTDAEIAEILFNLKDRFDILDVVWGDVVEDEEIAPEQGSVADLPVQDELPAVDQLDADTGEVSSLLVQVIDMMKADAEARAADAQARRAEAEAKEAAATSLEAAAKVRQEEQILDMESYDKKEKDVTKEAKRLAKLAKWRHDMTDSKNDITDMDELIPSYDKVTDTGRSEEPVDIKVDVEDEEETQAKRRDLVTMILNKGSKK